ncbi:sensor histidine kinase [Paenibacillus sp. OV219]|uniref:sensor histidine kinase n=1 Tax=Paenibacillus sp. OV219 TaxID=1884377 RepID=UPI0008D8D33D|nr:HAMP domain-containing sensor histidine kinase [Paenibacillus sp. OV219]SEN55968.1 Signal transduction histidine kinase [Paenibacillus sp. OV219]
MLFRLVEFMVLTSACGALWRKRRSDPRLVSHWLSACLFLLALQRLANGVQLYALPPMKQASPEGIAVTALQIFVFLSYYAFVLLFPYTILMGITVFAELSLRATGVVLLSLYFQTFPSFYKDFDWFWPILFGCVLFGVVFLGLLFRSDTEPLVRLQYFKSLIVAFAALLVLLLFIYSKAETRDASITEPAMDSGFLRVHTPDQFFNAIAFTMLVVFGYFAFKYGKFGLRLHHEKQRQERSMSALKSGTAILNHTIKNELDKLTYLEERIRTHLWAAERERIEGLLDHIPKVTGHLQQMVQRIQDKTGELSLVKTQQPLHGILEMVLEQLRPYAERKCIRMSSDFGEDIIVFCDPVHLQEALLNLGLNAIDAMETGLGILGIRASMTKKVVIIEVQDNGSGIPKESLDKVFEPFYTTKKTTNHFGLGLGYCRSVAQKHAGTLRIVHSEPNKGTTIAMTFQKLHFMETPASRADT